MRPLLALLALLALSGAGGLAAAPARAQAPSHDAAPPDTAAFDPTGHFAVYTAAGRPADLDAVVAAMADADVVFLGEVHDDPTTHALERRLLEAAQQRYGAQRPVALSFEMFERDVQLVLDEYLAGLIRERDFLAAARPWGNYATDYRPALEYAKAHGLAVIAANTPERYVSRVGREGPASLEAFSEAAQAYLPPRPLAPASDALAARFQAEMADMMAAHGASGPDMGDLLAAQNLRDATMAYAIAGYLAQQPGALVVQLNGSFHSEHGLGVPEHLARYAPEARPLVVTFRPAADFREAPEPGEDAFVILTDQAAIPER